MSGQPTHDPIDWTEVRSRLRAAQEASERALDPAAGEIKRILKARAQALAGAPAREEAGESLEVVSFLLSTETYGLESRWVREIFPLRTLTPLPWCPRLVAGMVNVRGTVLPVIDIKKLFGLPDKGLADLNKVLIIQNQDMELGILADQILGIRTVLLQQMQAALPTLSGIREDYLRGITSDRLVILDGEKLLAHPSLAGQAEMSH